VHEGTFVIRVPVTIPAGADSSQVLTVVANAQACNDRECLPPADGRPLLDYSEAFFPPGYPEKEVLYYAKTKTNRQVCVDAIRLATKSGSSAMVAENTVILSYYDMVTQICAICNLLSKPGEIGDEQRHTLQEAMNRLVLAGGLNINALRAWERTVAVGVGGARFREGLEATENTVKAVGVALKPYGVRNTADLLVDADLNRWSPDWQFRVLNVQPYSKTEMPEQVKIKSSGE
jgi:hypothetical protein